MPLVSAFTVIRGISIFHLTVAYFLLTDPRKIAEQNIVVIFGQAMQIPTTSDLLHPSEPTALAALILTFFSISDILASLLPNPTSLDYWLSQTPVRLLMFFCVTAWTYLGSISSAEMGVGERRGGFAGGRAVTEGNAGVLWRNDLVFTAGFVEISVWFWIFLLLKEERRVVAEEMVKKQHEKVLSRKEPM